MKIHNFLESWGIINFNIDTSTKHNNTLLLNNSAKQTKEYQQINEATKETKEIKENHHIKPNKHHTKETKESSSSKAKKRTKHTDSGQLEPNHFYVESKGIIIFNQPN